MIPLRDIVNDTPADAEDVEFNFNTIETEINEELISRDGTVAMTAPLNLTAAAPISDTHAANKSYVDSVLAVNVVPGLITQYAGSTAPTGWVFCDGAAYNSGDSVYAALFAVIGNTYGDPGGGNFNVPDMRSRVSSGLNAADPAFNTLGKKAGERDSDLHQHAHTQTPHTHTGPSHTHSGTTNTDAHSHQPSDATASNESFLSRLDTYTGATLGFEDQGAGTHIATRFDSTTKDDTHSHGFTTGSSGTAATGPGGDDNTGATGVGIGTDANLPPYLVLNYLIRL